MSKKSLSELFKRWSNRGQRVAMDASQSRNRVRLRLEEVEQRLAPATLPPVTASDTRTLPGGNFAPQAVADPTNPNTIVVVSATNPTVGAVLSGQISRDAGQTWTNFTIANPDTGVNAGPGGTQLTTVNSPSVAFSRTGDLYVAWTSTTTDFFTAGVLRVASFTVPQVRPASGNGVAILNPSVVLYQWLGQDPVFNPTIAVDNNVDEYTDPDTALSTPQDTMLRADNSGKAVYVAWNTNARTPTVVGHTPVPPATQVFTPTVIFAAASRDRGLSYSTPVPVNTGGFVTFNGGVAPQILFTPGDLNPNTADNAGQLMFVWTRPDGLGRQDTSRPDGGILGNEATTNYQSPTGAGTPIFEPGIDPNNGPDIPVNSNSTITVNINNTATSTNGAFFTSLSDINVTLALSHPHVNQLQITLIPPFSAGVGSITLLASRIDGAGNVIPTGGGALQGLLDNNDTSGNTGIGVANGVPFGTVFDSEAARLIHDPANTAPYIAHYRPEYGTLAALYGTDILNLNGPWTLRIQDVRDDDRNAGNTPGVPQFLNSWSMKMSSLISNSGFGADSSIPTSGAFGQTLPTGADLGGTSTGNATAVGFGVGASYAYDNSVGAFSPHSGRLYVAYTAPGLNDNQDVFVRYSDNSGATWSGRIRVNDDSASDNFTEGNRAQFMPSLTVDSVTGTVVVMWYDTRLDASIARVSTFLATSIDGGDTFSTQGLTAFLNNTKDATDQLTRSVLALEPVPTNLRAIGAYEAGQRQSVLAHGGQIKPFWTGNQNAGGSNIYTATVQTSAGPRVIDNSPVLNSDQGAVTTTAPGTYNNTFTNDGTRKIDGFTLTFDRLIDIDSFNTTALLANPDLVRVLFRAPGTERDSGLPATLIPVASINALNPTISATGLLDNATRYFVQFATPQSAAGTYSYAVGPYVSDRVRAPSRQGLFTATDTPTAIPDLELLDSTITVPVLGGTPAPLVQGLEVMVNITHPFVNDLKITLYGPDPDGLGNGPPISVVLSDRNGGGGNNYSNTRFNDSSLLLIQDQFAPFSGIYQPETPLSVFNGSPLAGNWTLRIEDLQGEDVGTLNSWSITFLDALGNPITVSQNKSFLDQDGDGRTREIGTNFDPSIPKAQQPPHLYTDAYAVPGSFGKDQFNVEPLTLSVNPNTLPLISTGPHLLVVGQPGETTQVSFATRDATNAFLLHITLDRAVDVTTFDAFDISAVVAQSGTITGTIQSVRPTLASDGIASKFDITYTAALPTGKYTVTLGPNILVADGMFRNITADQLQVRFDRDINPATFTAANILRITGPAGDIADVQNLKVLGTAGTFTVTFDNGSGPQSTPALPFSIPASGGTTDTSSLQNAIAALTNVGVGNVVVTVETLTTGGRLFHITFTGVLRSNQPALTTVGAGGTTVTVDKGLKVELVALNAFTGGARVFTVKFPTQNLSGPYAIEFGQDPFGNSIRAVNLPQLVDVHFVAPIVDTVRTGVVGAPEIQTVRVVATSGTFTLNYNGATTAPLPFNATAGQVEAALNGLTTIGGVGGTASVTASGKAGDITYTILFGGSLASGDLPQVVAAFTAPRNDLTVIFDRDIPAGTFVTGDIATNIIRVTGPSGNIPIGNIASIVQDSDRQFRIVFNAPLPAGQYVVDFNEFTTVPLRVAGSGPAIDMDFNAGLETLRGDDSTSNDLAPIAYSSATPAAIAPATPGGFKSTTNLTTPSITETSIIITDDYIIRQSQLEQIRVLLNITHPNVSDLDIDLIPPDATGVGPIRLFTGLLAGNISSSQSANFENTLLVDRVGDPNVPNILAGSPPYRSGSRFYSPQTPLSTLVGKSSLGVWRLRVTNNGDNVATQDPNYSGEPIQITNWSLTLPKALTVQTQYFARTSGVLVDPATVVGTVTTAVVSNSTLFVPVDFAIDETTLHQIQLLLNISHPNVRDLNIDLVPPTATGVGAIRLFTGATLSPSAPNQTANFTNTRLLNKIGDSTPSIQTAIPPFNAGEAGFFSPQNSLSSLIGKSSFGTWTLQVTNNGTNPTTIDPNFNASAPIQISNWSLTFPRKVPTTGLGQATADRFQAGFRVFTQDPTNSLTRQTWTPVGPAPTNETANAARISAMAVDPTDPTSNTVYVAVAGGGIWKTTDFLNSSSSLQNGGLVPKGPSYVPLTDFGPTSAVNVSSLALFARNSDPHQTIVFALTGEGSTEGKLPGRLTQSGVGVIRSLNGGRTWQVLDSTTNVDSAGNILPMSDQNTRNHLFVGATGYKIVVDPTPGKDGGVIVYMALSGNANQNGLWRSLNGGNTWSRVMAGNATDVVLSNGSANPTDPATGKTVFEGNLQQLYAAFRNTPVAGGPGVYKTDSAPAAVSLTFMAGGTNNPLIRDISITGTPQITTALPVSIPNSGNRISLAVPSLTGDPLKDSFLKDWVYAMTDDATGAAQLYLTKDAGAHWTRVRIPNLPTLPDPTNPSQGGGTNNEGFVGRAQVDVDTSNDYNMALAIDPENPYIVYMAGAELRSIRLDLTKMRDAHNFTFYNNSDVVLGANAADPAFTTQINANRLTIGGLQPQIFQPANTPVRGRVRIGGSTDSYLDANGVPIGFLNLFGGRDYNQPFTTNSLIRVSDTSDSIGGPAGFFVNDGADISWSPFSDIFDPNVPDQTGSLRTQNRFSGINTQTILTFTDPVTNKTRLLFGTDDGVFTGVDSQSTVGSGTLVNGIGFSEAVRGNRNGNLQVSQFYAGAVQPSQLAADLAGALFYGMGDKSGTPVSSANILATGDLNWRGPTGDGAGVVVDQAGSGTAFQYRSPTGAVAGAGGGAGPSSFGFDLNATATNLDFFRVLSNTSDHAFGGGFSRTGNSSGSLFDFGDTWNSTTASLTPRSIPQPNANPTNPNVLMFGSVNGRVYRTTDQGVTWNSVASPANLDGTAVLSVAFGASDPTRPTLTNNFLYAGTNGGQIYSTTTGGAPWTLIGSMANGFASNGLNPGAVQRVVPNPKVGAKDLFVITTGGVFYKADGTTATGNWVNITGNLFNLTRTVFGVATDQDPALRPNSLSALAVDWRYAFPDPNIPGATFPLLYAAGDGGVFRTVDFGITWTFFPDVATDGATVEGGYLPNTHITDLDLSIGDLDPATGRYKAGGLNMLVATTYGRGTFAIRLSTDLPAASFISGPRVVQLINPNPVGGPSTELDVKFGSAVDPSTFTAADVHLTDSNGTIIPITSVKMISVVDANGVNPRNLFAVTFPAQTGTVGNGSFAITIGYNPTGGNIPLISDPSGFLMNQDSDLINGEPVVDQYTNTIIFNSATNNRLVVTMFSPTATAGVATPVTIEARDTNDLLLIGVNGTLTFSPAPGTGTFTPNTASLINGIATFNITFQTAGPQTVIATFSSTPPVNINSTAWTTTVSAAAASQFVLTPASSNLAAGATQTFTLTAQDSFGNTDTTYSQTATITRTGAAATLPGTVTVTSGTVNFNGTFNTSGTVQITATGTDPANPPNGTLTGTANVVVTAGPATLLGFSISPGPYAIGDTATITISALDAQNNLAGNLNGSTLTIGISPSGSITPNPAAPVFTNGVATYTVTFTAAGTFTFTGTAPGPLTVSSGPIVVNTAPPPPSPTQLLPGLYAVGSGVNGSTDVFIYNQNGSLKSQFTPFPAGFSNEVDPASGGFLGGNRVAVGDVTGDGVPDYVVGTGPSITAAIVVINGATGNTALTYEPFGDFKGGVFVSVGDITGDGINDIAITPDEGGGPRVTVLQGGKFARIANYFGIEDPAFRGGARSAIGDLNGDGFSELVVSAGFNGGPRISVFDGRALSQGRNSHPVGDFFLFEETLRNGAYVAVGDVDGDGFSDIIGGAGPGGGPRVLVISGKKLLESGPDGPLPALAAPIANFFGGDTNSRGGIRVAAKNLDLDRAADIITGSGATDESGNPGGSRISAYLGANLLAGNTNPVNDFDLLLGYSGGVFVG